MFRDHALLGGEFAPITDEIGFVEAPAETVRDWLGRNPDVVGVETVPGDLCAALASLLPLRSWSDRRLVVPTDSSWVAVFDNTWRGTDANSVVSFAADELGCRSARVVAVPNTFRGDRGRYGAAIFTLHDGAMSAWPNVVRSVGAVNDGGRWVFDISGEPQPFEELDVYELRRIKDRLTPQRIWRYLGALGIRALDEAFYAPREISYLVEERTWPESRTYSLDEARADW